jgi:N-methylhydantoinase A
MAREFNFGIDLLYANQVHVLTIPLEPEDLATDGWLSQLRIRFEKSYRTRYGYHQPGQPIHIRTVRLAAVGRLPRPKLTEGTSGSTQPVQPVGERSVYLGEWVTASVYNLKGLQPGRRRVSGPAVVDGEYTTVLLPPDCSAEVDPWGGLIIDVS